MKCPKCNKEGISYINKQKVIREGKSPRERFKRTDNMAKCRKCGWEGKI